MIYFKIRGTGEAPLDVNDLLRVQLKNDNVQGVLLSMTNVPDEDILESVYKKQLHYSEELKPLMAVYFQDTVQKGERASYAQLGQMVRCFVEEKMRDKNFNARNEDRSLQRGSSLERKLKRKSQRQRAGNDERSQKWRLS